MLREEAVGVAEPRFWVAVLRWLCVGTLFASTLPAGLRAYTFTGARWVTTPVVMHLQLGPATEALLDGHASWTASAEAALALWNSNVQAVRFASVADSGVTRREGNGANNVFFAPDVYGDNWGSGVLAVAITHSTGAQAVESDVLFNSHVEWNSYRGPQRLSRTGELLFDFHRVALHEFGHVLGLDHPDTAGQAVNALMNSRIGHLGTLAADDVDGARALYGAPMAVAAPTITSQPASQTAVAGQDVSFSVGATSSAPMTYQWAKSGVLLSGATQAVLTLTSVSSTHAGTYSVTVTNSGGAVTSAPAILTVQTPTVAPPPSPPAPPPPPPPTTVAIPLPVIAPAILKQPTSQVATVGATVSFSITATGTAPLIYQWKKSGAPIAGATSAAYTVSSARASDAGSYTAVVSNAAGSATSAAATLAVHAAPAITRHPESHTTVAGQSLTLTVVATGTPTPTYQWFKDGAAMAGATRAALTVASVQPADAGAYTVVVANDAGSVRSAPASVLVLVPPKIVTAPFDRAAKAGAAVEFNVVVTGTPDVAYSWSKDGVTIPGATRSHLLFPAVQPHDAGTYAVSARNAAGTIMSPSARLTVNFSRLVNLSTRGFIAPGAALTPGFVVRGAGAKELLVRGVGPALRIFGVDDALAAPALQLSAVAATPLAFADSGENVVGIADLAARVGAFPLPPGSADAAVRASVADGSYTVRISPSDPSAAGVALAELYDADALNSSARLVNASTLGFVGLGERALMPGFVIRGDAPKRLLIRAIGPGLRAFGVTDVLLDPQLAVVPAGSSGTAAGNDNWSGTELERAFAQAGAFRLETGSKDAAVVVELPPGGYTVVISGVDGGTGSALVEIYDLDP